MKSKEKKLPSGWINAKLGDVLPLNYGKALTAKSRDRNGEYLVYGSSGAVDTHSEYIAQGPCLIIGRKGSAGSVHYSAKNCWPIDTAYYTYPSDNIEQKYFLYLLNHMQLSTKDNSTAIPSLSRDVYNNLQFPLAPLSEQKRIVEKIEKIFSDLDNVEANLKKIQSLINSCRQSVLKTAFSGQLLPQDLNDESACELLKKIKSENLASIKKSSLRKSKPSKKQKRLNNE